MRAERADVRCVQQERMRGKAARALLRYTRTAIADLQHDEDEMLRGVDWAAVEGFTDLRRHLGGFAAFAKLEEEDRRRRAWPTTTRLCACVHACMRAEPASNLHWAFSAAPAPGAMCMHACVRA